MPQKEAAYYEKLGDGKIRCSLCPRFCTVADGHNGFCKIRINKGGIFYQSMYNEISAFGIDPIEKKPLYHFYPSSDILSIGTNGCNLACQFCQNWELSQGEAESRPVTHEILLDSVRQSRSIGVAYTYNEPLVWFETVLDTSKFIHEQNLKNVIVSNGMINPEPLKELIPYIDAANIDIKGFTQEFYDWVKGNIKAVKETIKMLFEADVHIELTNLVVTGKNDGRENFEDMCRWIAGISSKIPLHISRYFPRFKYDAVMTPETTLQDFYMIAKKHLKYVYLGNIAIDKFPDHTYCYECGYKLVSRTGYHTTLHTNSEKCPQCGTSHYLQL